MIAPAMRILATWIFAVALAGSPLVLAQGKKPPEKLVIKNKGGDVVFTHAAHLNREKGECSTCHEKLWPQSTAEPMTNSDGCKTCHQADGAGVAFQMKGNCVRCHPSAN